MNGYIIPADHEVFVLWLGKPSFPDELTRKLQNLAM